MRTLIAVMLFAASFPAFSALKEEPVEYKSGGVTMKGFLVYDEAVTGKRPGVLVVHEWWGHNDHARNRARMLAELGYTALAVDMYGDGKKADHPDEAGAFATEVMNNMPAAKSRFTAAMELLKRHKTVDAKNIAAIGYCFGGSVVLNMARLGVDLKGVVSFHGGLTAQEPAKKGKVKARMLVCNGADDPLVSKESIEEFKEEMTDAHVNFEFKNYEGATHSFTNPNADAIAKEFGMPVGYSASADRESWEDMKAFLKKVLGK